MSRENLHHRVRRFITQSMAGEAPRETFDQLGLALASYQAESSAGMSRLLRRHGITLNEGVAVRDLPAVPTEAFRLTRLAGHSPGRDAAIFRTSGTTAQACGQHHFSTLRTYDQGALAWGRWALCPEGNRFSHAMVLAPRDAPDSSLGFMMARFAEELAVWSGWFLDERGIALPPMRRAIDAAHREASLATRGSGGPSRPAGALVMGTSFAYVHLLDALQGASLPLPSGSVVVHTGGFKGRSREVAPEQLRADLAKTFDLPLHALVGEYGMTELASQLYETGFRDHHAGASSLAEPGVFVPPPWLRVVPVDAESLKEVTAGQAGLLRFEDLANVDSALVVQTADRGLLAAGGGVRLLGRAASAPPRGCSLAIDDLLAGQGASSAP